MLLGILAGATGIIYALVKFLTTLRLRHLRETRAKTQHDLQKARKRIEVLEGKLQVERSKKNRLRQETIELRAITGDLRDRLRGELPQNLQPGLEKCLVLAPEADPGVSRLLHDLKLADSVAKALDSLSLLVVEFLSEDQSARMALVGQFVQLLEKAEIHFHSPDQASVVCVFEQPDRAVDLVRTFVHNTPGDRKVPIRGGLYTGMHITDEDGAISRFLAQHLQRAQKLAERAIPAALLMNEKAYQGLGNQEDIHLFDEVMLIYELSWTSRKKEEEATS